MTDDEKIRVAERAQAILGDPLVVQALATIKADVIRQWKDSRPNEIEGREALWAKFKVAEAFEQELRGHIASGKIAQQSAREHA